ncbi:MAG: hypothetical protein JSV44_12830 [Candidatus Zixiibacteriota bacterium]|nr:MAG: hypothetical protein JSV44_12830 [candidate division Zixibacteria bacterium]
MREKKEGFIILGKVVEIETGRGISALIVEALDKDLFFDDRLGSVLTDRNGDFQIRYDREDFQELFFDRKPDIYLRVRAPNGEVLHTTEDKVRYEAGKTEIFTIAVSKTIIEEGDMQREKLSDYKITGKIDAKQIEKVELELPLQAYAVRARRVLGRASINKDGSFEIRYRDQTYGKDEQPYGVDLIIGPELPGDQILDAGLERKFLPSKGFKRSNPGFDFPVGEMKMAEAYFESLGQYEVGIKRSFVYTGFVYTCSPLVPPTNGSPTCYNQQALSGSETEAYVRLISPIGNIIAEDIEIDNTGRFSFIKVWFGQYGEYGKYDKYYMILLATTTKVEVYQKTDAGDHILYTGEHQFNNNVAEYIFIDRDEVEIISRPPDPTAGVGNYFGFERIGNLVVEAIYRSGEITGEFGAGVPVPAKFIGYANSQDKPGVVTGSADIKVKDYALGGVLHLYANLGESFGKPYAGGIDMSEVTVKYFRVKYSYANPETDETIGETYLSTPFLNTRNVTGGTAAEFMGAHNTHPDTSAPLPHPTYVYPNPFDTDPDRDWKYRGLLLVLNTYTLPRKYGLYTFTVEPLDTNMNPVAVADPGDCQMTILIDNDHAALTGAIENVLINGSGTTVCGLLDLQGMGLGTKNLKVKYNLHDTHGNLGWFNLAAEYGESKSVTNVTYPGPKKYGRSGSTPYWNDVVEEATITSNWPQCAYQFRIRVWRRVTNGFHTICSKEFTYHLTIQSDVPYSSAP